MSLSLWIFLALVGVLCKQISHEARTRQHPSTTGESFLHVNTILITWIMNDSLFGLYIEFKYSCIYMYLQLFYHTFLLLSSEFSSLKLLFVPIAKRSKRLVMMLQITWLTAWQSLDAALMGEHWPAANTGLRIEDRDSGTRGWERGWPHMETGWAVVAADTRETNHCQQISHTLDFHKLHLWFQ